MRQVNWSSNERVDLPDMAAMGFFAEAENRRLTRLALVGMQGITGVLRGFQVEPEAPATARVIVVMDHTTSESLALGAEFLGAATEYGVLIGGRTTDESLEGPAQLILDFTAQPPGTYFVEMRYAQTTGENDARAFWSEGTLTEGVASVDTRILPSWQVQIVAAPTGGEWLVLGEVVWGGGVINAVDITDRRNVLYELADLQTDTFDKASQSVGLDFDRDPARGDYVFTIGSPMQAIRALQRQILDLKGQDDTGVFNWYARPPGVVGGGIGSTFTGAKQTKSLRSVDTVTFTVGMSDEYGDFSGVTGLQECLSHIEERQDELPRRIVVLLKNREQQVLGNTAQFEITTPIVLVSKDLEIIGGTGGGYQAIGPTDGRGNTLIKYDDIAPGATALKINGSATLKMDRITFSAPADLTLGQKALFVNGAVDFSRVELWGASESADAPVLSCGTDGTVIEDSKFVGDVNIGGSADLAQVRGGRITNTYFGEARVRLRLLTDMTVFPAAVYQFAVCNTVKFQNCTFFGPQVFAGAVVPNEFGMVDARGAFNTEFDGCRFFHSADENGVYLGNLYSAADLQTGSVNFDIKFSKCAFSLGFAAHVANGGVNGADGSGWHIFNKHESLTGSNEQTTGLSIEDCHFAGTSALQSLDAGAISLLAPRNLRIKDNRFTNWSDVGVGGINTMIRILSQGVGVALPVDLKIKGNYFGDWIGDPVSLMSIFVNGARNVRIEDNTFIRWGRGFDESIGVVPPLPPTLVTPAMVLANITDSWILHNSFRGFAIPNGDQFDDSRCILLSGLILTSVFRENLFSTYSGSAIYASDPSLVSNCAFDKNIFEPGNDEDAFYGGIDLFDALTDQNQFIGNRWTWLGGSTFIIVKQAINVGAGLLLTVTSNHFHLGAIGHNTLAGAPAAEALGYANATVNFNVALYN